MRPAETHLFEDGAMRPKCKVPHKKIKAGVMQRQATRSRHAPRITMAIVNEQKSRASEATHRQAMNWRHAPRPNTAIVNEQSTHPAPQPSSSSNRIPNLGSVQCTVAPPTDKPCVGGVRTAQTRPLSMISAILQETMNWSHAPRGDTAISMEN